MRCCGCRLIMLFLMCWIISCAQKKTEKHYEITQVNGVNIVENRAPADSSTQLNLKEVVVLKSSEDIILRNPRKMLSSNGYFMLDGPQDANSRILVFDKEGNYQREIGTKGIGPGDYEY